LAFDTDVAFRSVRITFNPGCARFYFDELSFVAAGSITIVKDAIPDSPVDFAFTSDFGDFELDDDADPTLPLSRTFDVSPGTYALTETGALSGTGALTDTMSPGWLLTDLTCADPDGQTTTDPISATAAIDLDPGEHVI